MVTGALVATTSAGPLPNVEAAGKPSRVDICHLGHGVYGLINMSERAMPAHLRHGDALPGQIVGGLELDATCTPVTPAAPSIDIELFVNGHDADNPPGPTFVHDSTLTFAHVVTNDGDVPLDDIVVVSNVSGTVSCPRSELGVGESMECTPTTTTAKFGTNFQETCVEGVDAGLEVDDCDPVHYNVPPPPDAP